MTLRPSCNLKGKQELHREVGVGWLSWKESVPGKETYGQVSGHGREHVSFKELEKGTAGLEKTGQVGLAGPNTGNSSSFGDGQFLKSKDFIFCHPRELDSSGLGATPDVSCWNKSICEGKNTHSRKSLEMSEPFIL